MQVDDVPETHRLSELEVKLLQAVQLFTAQADKIAEMQDEMTRARLNVIRRKKILEASR